MMSVECGKREMGRPLDTHPFESVRVHARAGGAGALREVGELLLRCELLHVESFQWDMHTMGPYGWGQTWFQ